ncbi:hydroxyacid dehydrogenase [Shumkonia mesophila]|uniref:hydroxyacid dehydrogenase n=1 Tax=Shumkonia mesophila TaxID=2838854 RepID=UPI0029343EFB|nr:hydroxyacid dehydrogenase [Shumkonia mesophila]
MSLCLLIQPIHASGIALLEDAGLTVCQASKPDMETVAKEIVPAVAAITRNAGLNRAAMDAAPDLKVLGNHGIGTDPVDVAHATEIGLPIIFTPYGNVQSVAEFAISQMLAIARRTREADRAVRAGNYDYRYARDFVELQGKTLLVVGFGRIGCRTAEIAKAAFAMRVLAYDPYLDASVLAAAGAEKVDDLDAALDQADIVSLHLQLTPETRTIMNRDRLYGMKKGAMLVNTARGALVDADALIEALEDKQLRGAAMDTFEKEPLAVEHPYAKTDRLVLSPHIGGATEECLERTAVQTAEQVIQVLKGIRPPYLVNPTVWDRRR